MKKYKRPAPCEGEKKLALPPTTYLQGDQKTGLKSGFLDVQKLGVRFT